jgi:hypothetical protein
VNGVASLLLLFVAVGLLVLAGVSIGRTRGREPSERDAALMAAMVGAASAFLLMILLVTPLVVLPGLVIGVLVTDWVRGGRLLHLGAFCFGGGLLVATMQTLTVLNDLSDPAVSVPGWTPIPLAASVAITVVGVALLIAHHRGRSDHRPTGGRPC